MAKWKKASEWFQKKSGVDAFTNASAAAVSSDNIPGVQMDMNSEHSAARAARVMQQAFQEPETMGADTVVVHMPEQFGRVRSCFGRSLDQYRHSLTEGPFRFLGEEEAAGKSSAFFVFTEDGRYCLKSIDPQEAQMLLRVVEDYEQYVSNNPTTLLPKFYGLYEIRLSDQKSPIWMLVQGNVLGGRHAVFQRFDLKGSTRGRHASASEKAKGHNSVLKDLDFVDECCTLVPATPEAEQEWNRCRNAMEKDAAWLASKGLIDYSLLLGFASCSSDALKSPLSHVNRIAVRGSSLGNMGKSVPAGDALVVYVGIIDVLMRYSWYKFFQDSVCSVLVSSDMSLQAPGKYASRFLNFVLKLGLPSGELQEVMMEQRLTSRRPLGIFLGEFGRKDMLTLLQSPSLIICTGVGVLMLSSFCRSSLRSK